MEEYLESRLKYYYECRQIAYENKVSTFVTDMLIEELEKALEHLTKQ